MVQINGKPLLEIWLENLIKVGVEEFIINTHYLSGQVEEFITKSRYKNKVKLVHEQELLGTAGTLISNIEFYKGEEGFLIHADNYCLANLLNFEIAHKRRPKNCVLSMMTFRADNTSECGIVELDEDGVVINFHEKKKNPPGNLANGAIYILSSEFLSEMNNVDKKIQCFSKEILPNYMGKIYAHEADAVLIDIGTVEAYGKVRNYLAP